MLSEISQRKTNTACFHLEVASKEQSKRVQTEETSVTKGERGRRKGE